MGRTPCCDKNNGLKKGPWTAEEDQKLMDYIEKHGHGSWRTLPKNAGLARCGKSCRLRWTNYLRPDIKRGRFSFEEEETIIQLHSILGNKWSAIAARLPGRTDNEIKNYWNTHIRKRLLRTGVDPVTHTLRLGLSALLTNPGLCAAVQLDLSRFFGIEPFINSELLRIATHLLNLNLQQQQHANNSQIHEAFQDHLLLNEAQLTQANVDQYFQPGYDHTNMSLENYVPATDIGCENDQQSSINFLSEYDSSFYFPNVPNYNITASVPSITISSPPQLNSSSTTNYFNSSTEDEKESYCSQLLQFQVPDLLDVSEFM